jgi:hypothetical protein
MWKFLKKIKETKLMTLLYHSWAYIRKVFKSIHKRDTMFVAALFTIAKLWNQPRYSTTDEWIKKIWCVRVIQPQEK